MAGDGREMVVGWGWLEGRTTCLTWTGRPGRSQPTRLGPRPEALAACGRWGSAATSPHEAQPMGGGYPGQPFAVAAAAGLLPVTFGFSVKGEEGVFDEG